jgi:hypothetical protein
MSPRPGQQGERTRAIRARSAKPPGGAGRCRRCWEAGRLSPVRRKVVRAAARTGFRCGVLHDPSQPGSPSHDLVPPNPRPWSGVPLNPSQAQSVRGADEYIRV